VQNYKLERGQKTEVTGRSPLRRQRSAFYCIAIEEEEEEELYT
jgi:hypothetical protein